MSKDANIAPAAAQEKENATEQMDRMLDSMVQPEEANKSQFQKPGDLVERDEDTGLVQVESLCMNCHENVSYSALIRLMGCRANSVCRERLSFCSSASHSSAILSSNLSNAHTATSRTTR